MKNKSDKDHMRYVLTGIEELSRGMLRLVGEAIGNDNAQEEVSKAMRIAKRANKLSKNGQGYVAHEIAQLINESLSDQADEMSDTIKGQSARGTIIDDLTGRTHTGS